MTKIDKTLVGRKIRLLSGKRVLVVKVTRDGYVMENNYVIAPDCLGPSGPGFKEIPSINAPAAKKTTARKSKVAKEEEAPVRATRRSRKVAKEEEAPVRATCRSRKVAKEEEAPAKVTRRSRKVAKEEEAPAKVTRRTSSEVKMKRVAKVDAELSDTIQTFMLNNIEALIKKSGYAFQIALVGCKYTDTALSVEIGLLPTNATEEDKFEYKELYEQTWDANEESEEESDEFDEFAEDDDESEEEDDESEEEDDESEEEDDESEEEDDESEESLDDVIDMVVADTSISHSLATKYVEGWFANSELMEEKFGDELQVGMLVENEEGHTVYIIGYSVDKKRIVVWDEEAGKVKGMTIGNIAKYDAVSENGDAEVEEEVEETSDSEWDDFEEDL